MCFLCCLCVHVCVWGWGGHENPPPPNLRQWPPCVLLSRDFLIKTWSISFLLKRGLPTDEVVVTVTRLAGNREIPVWISTGPLSEVFRGSSILNMVAVLCQQTANCKGFALRWKKTVRCPPPSWAGTVDVIETFQLSLQQTQESWDAVWPGHRQKRSTCFFHY
jgi:hypothetical protein